MESKAFVIVSVPHNAWGGVSLFSLWGPGLLALTPLTDSPNLSLVQFQPGPRYHCVSREWFFFFRAAMNSVIASSGNKWAEKVRATRWGRAWLWVTRTSDGWALLCSPLWWLETTEDVRQKYSYFGLKQVGQLVNLSGLCREVYFRVWFEYALNQVDLSGCSKEGTGGGPWKMLTSSVCFEEWWQKMWWIIFNQHTRVNYSSRH